jgi:hypothetical protein
MIGSALGTFRIGDGCLCDIESRCTDGFIGHLPAAQRDSLAHLQFFFPFDLDLGQSPFEAS